MLDDAPPIQFCATGDAVLISWAMLIYQASIHAIMAKAVKSMSLRFTPEQHAKMVKLKEQSGATSWEDFILKLVGIEE